jgi:peptidoglycan hydrolase CwlO-like protein
MSFLKKIISKAILIFIAIFIVVMPVVADDIDSEKNELENKITEYETKIAEAQGQQKTLASMIGVLNSQISLATIRVAKTTEEIVDLEAEIEVLSEKITLLDRNLDNTVLVLNSRIEETYKKMFFPSFYLLISSKDFSEFFSQIKYLRTAQEHDREILFEMEETKQNFDKQKELKEEKQEELEKLQIYLENQKRILDQQKAAKQDLLAVTKNDEVKYQSLLAQARAEYEAIQAIIAGRGAEEEMREVKAGETIASVISGSSCNSSGSHLHFTVAQDGNAFNPFAYLKSVDHENCSGPGACSEGDAFNPSGGWDWPISPKIRMNQGYGSTWAVRNTWVGQIYSFHNGIDILGSSNTVRAVRDGILYRGSYSGSGGCRLRYVRVDHKDSDLETFYLHVNY